MTNDHNALLLAAAAGLDAERAQLEFATRNLETARGTWQHAATTYGRAEPARVDEAYQAFQRASDAKDAQQHRYDAAYQKYVALAEVAASDPARSTD